MALPADLATVTVTGTFTDPAGSPQRGFVTFTPSAALADAGDSLVIAPVARRYELAGGTFTSEPMAATDASVLLPGGWFYVVTVCVQGAPAYSFASFIPSSPSPVDISALSPLEEIPAMAGYLPLSGGQLSGPLYASESPQSPAEVATKAYVDSATSNLSAKAPVQEATATALPANTYLSGTLTANFTGALTVDGVAVVAGDRVLVKNETATADNGIYAVTAPGSSLTPYVLTRSADMGTGTQVPGAYAYVEKGTANKGSGWIVASAGPFTLGTTAITWTQMTGLGEITAGTGLSASGNTLSLSVPVSVADGGTGSVTQNFTDLTTNQSIAGIKTFTGEIIVPVPVNSTDAATKAYADGVAQGLQVKQAVNEATAAALPANSYSSGVLTATSSGALAVDGVNPVLAGDRVLVKNESAAANNGIYTVTVAGDGSTAYVLTRSTDMDSGGEVPGAFVFVEAGTVNQSTGWVVSGAGPFTIGTTAITFTQFSAAGSFTAGAGLTLTGSTISLTSPVTVAHGGSGATTASAAPWTGLLTKTAVKTTTYTAAAGDYVACDTTSGAFTVTLPNAPAANTVAGVKLIASSATPAAVTVACAGSDVINKTSGATTYTLSLVNQGVTLQYASGIWLVQNDDLPLGQLDNRYPTVVNVKSFGATGGGSVADDTAIQAAITACSGAGGGIVWFPPGNYKLTTGLTMASKVMLRGAGGLISILRPASGVTAITATGSSGSQITQTAYEDIGITGVGQGVGSAPGMSLTWCTTGTRLSRLYIELCGGDGIIASNSYTVSMRDCVLVSNGANGLNAQTSINSWDMSGNTSLLNTQWGYYIMGGVSGVLSCCDAESNGYGGVALLGTYSFTVEGGEYENNGSSGSGQQCGIYLGTGSGGYTTAHNTILRGNFLQGTSAADYGIVVDGADLTLIDSNGFQNNLTNHIKVTANATGTRLGVGNYFSAPGSGNIADAGTATQQMGYDSANAVMRSPGMSFGTVAGAADVTLTRAAAGRMLLSGGSTLGQVLKITNTSASTQVPNLYLSATAATDLAVGTVYSGASFLPWEVTAGGTIKWGSGTANPDTTLSRSAAGTLSISSGVSVPVVIQPRAAQSLASNGAVTINAASGDPVISLAANATSSSITNPVADQILRITWIQDATGGRTYSWPANCHFAGASAPSDTTASRRTTVTFRYDSAGTAWYELDRSVAAG